MISDTLEIGDVILFGAHGPQNDHLHGHITVFTGQSGSGRFSSDFRQKIPNIWTDGHSQIDVYRYCALL